MPQIDLEHLSRKRLEKYSLQEMLPPFLQPTEKRWTATCPALRKVQEMKDREVEHVRYRSTVPELIEPDLQCVEHAMRTRACQEIETRVDLAELSGTPGSASVHPAAFIKARHEESLWVTKLKHETFDGAALREQYHELFRRFPTSTVLKRGEDMDTVLGQAKAVVGLVNKHAGEIVEMDRMKMRWILHFLAPGSASVEWSSQWNCNADGSPTDTPRDFEYGYPKAQDSLLQMGDPES